MFKVCSNSALDMKEIQFPSGWWYHEIKRKGEKNEDENPHRYWKKKLGPGNTLGIRSKKMALMFLEELEKCGDEVEAVKVAVPYVQEVYNKITKGRSESRVTQKKRKVSINHTKTTILRQKAAKLEKNVADLEKESEMQKKDRTQVH